MLQITGLWISTHNTVHLRDLQNFKTEAYLPQHDDSIDSVSEDDMRKYLYTVALRASPQK